MIDAVLSTQNWRNMPYSRSMLNDTPQNENMGIGMNQNATVTVREARGSDAEAVGDSIVLLFRVLTSMSGKIAWKPSPLIRTISFLSAK